MSRSAGPCNAALLHARITQDVSLPAAKPENTCFTAFSMRI
jgi:hypothetical protein